MRMLHGFRECIFILFVRDKYPHSCTRHDFTPPPPPKNITDSILVCGTNFVGITGKSVTWLPKIISREVVSMALPESLAGSSEVCGDVT